MKETTHTGTIGYTPRDGVWLTCTCGWKVNLGYHPELTGIVNVFYNHTHESKAKKTESGKVILTLEEALKRLPATSYIHTFIQGGTGGTLLIGADWSRERILELLTQASKQTDEAKQIQETGDAAQRMDHGIAAFDPGSKQYIFIEAAGPDAS